MYECELFFLFGIICILNFKGCENLIRYERFYLRVNRVVFCIFFKNMMKMLFFFFKKM